jgi:acyl-CoA reductase-like NAD-dependent aldehyde dehydrogenase/nicotinamidase-related amidase
LKPLLLLVDLQRDYLEAPDLDPPAAAIVRRAKDLLEGSRTRGLDVAHVWTTVSREHDDRMPHWKREGRWLCVDGTSGHEPPHGLEALEGEPIIHKTFFSPFAAAPLGELLRERETDVLMVCGVHLHGCVREAVIGAYERGLDVWVAEDAVGSNDPVHAAISRRYLESRAARFLPGDQALAELGSDPTGADERPKACAAGGTGIATAAGEVRQAAASCREAFRTWSAQPLEARLEVLDWMALKLEGEADALAELMAAEIGKPVRYGGIEAPRTAETLRAVARHAREPTVETLGAATLHRRPLGVVAIITPWNNPIYIPLGKIAPALAYGNAVLWKPAPAAQPIAERIVSLLGEAGLPPGVLGLAAGDRSTAEAAMTDPSVGAVSITGSSAAGFAAQEVCARRRIPLQGELGGNNAALVWADADLEHAAAELAEGAFAQAGQRCTANRRVVVHHSQADQLLELLRAQTAALPWGDPRDPAVSVGPIVDRPSRERVAAAVAEAARHADTIEVPHGTDVPPNGAPAAHWYPPTIIHCDDPNQEIVQQETFGPVLVVQRAHDWEQAMALVAGVPQGLAAALFSSSPEYIDRFQREVPSGIVKLNRSTADAEVDVPFGGWKASGIGPPEHGRFDRDFYTRPQVVYA